MYRTFSDCSVDNKDIICLIYLSCHVFSLQSNSSLTSDLYVRTLYSVHNERLLLWFGQAERHRSAARGPLQEGLPSALAHLPPTATRHLSTRAVSIGCCCCPQSTECRHDHHSAPLRAPPAAQIDRFCALSF